MDYRATLFIDGVEMDSDEGTAALTFSTATVLLGQGSASPPNTSEWIFDDVQVIREGSNIVADPGMEGTLLPYGLGITGPFWGRHRHTNLTASATQVSSPVHSGSLAGRVLVPSLGSENGGYFFQDLSSLSTGEAFCFDLWMRPESGYQQAGLLFDWDRSLGYTAGTASVARDAGGLSWSAWGVGGTVADIPDGAWSHIELCLETLLFEGWVVGEGFGPHVPPGFLV